ncbi:MAG: phage major capsid protein [Alphaproteobacteria bacterium]|nr:phage major capsid protein [Alphaproteobacteria bacterium]MBQ7284865.1 phage major capsid protein [Alphaproteobacteria bacterium]
MPNTDYNDILTTTLESRSGKLADNVSENSALLNRLKNKGKIRPVSGGSKIIEELEYGEGDMTWYSGYDTISYTPKQLFSAAEFSLKLCAVPVAISGEDILKNSGREQVIDLFEKRVDNAMKTMSNKMAAAVYGDGTEAAGKSIGGLALLVADSPATGTVGGINRAASGNEFWRNKSITLNTALTSDTIRKEMDKMYLSLCRGSDKPDLIVCGNELYSMYEASLMPQQRFVDNKLADAGFQNLKFKGADVVFDGGQNGRCPENKIYFLNTDYIYLRNHKERNMKVIGGERMAINQDALYKIIGWAGNMTMSNASLQGVLINHTSSATE